MKARTRRRSVALVALGMVGALALAACGSDKKESSSSSTPAAGSTADKPKIVVGSANFPESQLLMEIYGQQLEKNGYTIEPQAGHRLA